MSVLLQAAPLAPLVALRASTRAHHDRIDRLMDLGRLGERGRYVRVLQVFDAFLVPWEAAVLAALPRASHAWFRARSRRRFLADDLRALDAAQAAAVALAPLPGAAAAWGSMYVMEGSALGGQVITRALAAGGLRPDCGAAYFHGWGASTGAMWHDFRQRLDRELDSADAVAQACDSACLTFDLLSRLLEDALHERAPAA